MTLYRATLRDTAAQLLAAYAQPASVLIGQRWPVEPPQLPALLVDMREEIKTQADRSAGTEPSFAVAATLVVRARAVVFSEPLAAPFGAAHGPAIEAVCDTWLEKIQDGLLSDPRFPRMISKIPSVRVETAAETSGEQIIAEVSVTFTLAWEESYPPRGDDLLGRLVLRVDAIDPQDPNGAYPQTPGFPAAAPPPRSQGPDGRAEIGADLDIPTT